MFADLPEQIKSEVLFYLESDDFIQAKKIYDAWRGNCTTGNTQALPVQH